MKVQELSSTMDRKQKKKPKRRFLWLKVFMTVSLLLGALVLIALSPFFNITDIKVNGSKHYKAEDIIGSTNLTKGENGFRLLAKNIAKINDVKRFLLLRCAVSEDGIMENRAYIKTVNVKYILPGTFEISIVERLPMGFVPYMGTNLVVDNEAYVVDTIIKPGEEKLPFIKGLNFSSYEMGQALKLENPLEFETVKKMLQIMKDSEESGNIKLSAPINYIDVGNISKVCVLIDSRITVNFGDIDSLSYEELLYRVNFFKQIFSKNLKKQDKGLVDFTMGENPKFIPQQ